MMTATEVAAPGAATGASPAPASDLVMLCHDLRAAVRGVLDGVGLVDPAGIDPLSREQLDRAAASARTVEALIGIVESEAEHVAVEHVVTVETEAFLDALRNRHAGAAREHGVGFAVVLAADAPVALRLDAVALARTLDNLIDGALRSAGGTGDVRVEAEAGAMRGGILFRVSAVGTAPTRRPQATSLGDRIARSLAARIGGVLYPLDDEAGASGTELSLPAHCVASPAERPPRAGLNGLRVLLAEDNPTNQMVASQMLRALGARVIVCADGAEALTCFAQQDVDLVLVDIEMPRISGIDVIRAIRARTDARGRVPIVALTAYAMREHRERIAAAGADGLIPKPLTSIEALARSLSASVAQAPLAVVAVPSDTPRAPSAEPVIDAAVFEALCETIGRDTVAELLEKVVSDMMAARLDLAGAVAPLDRDRVRSASHILISVAGALGAVRLQSRARSLNGMVPAGLEPEIVENVHLCLSEIDAAVAFARTAAS